MNMQSLRQPLHPLPRFSSIASFFDWAERQERIYELVDGAPHLLPWVKLNHARIVTNLLTLIASRIDRDVLEVTAGDFAVQVGSNSVRFADVMVFPAGKDGSLRTVSDAVLLIEVLSESTAHVDLDAKLHEYQALDALGCYVVIDQDRVHVRNWTRSGDGSWPSEASITDDRPASVTMLQFELLLAEVYRGVN